MQKVLLSREDVKHRPVKGFTLIELLVVVAIISVLAGILFPVFARARENARRASCMSNLKQMGLGMMMYTQDYDERFPLQLGKYPAFWGSVLQPYVKSTQVFFCPDDSLHKSSNGLSTSNLSYGYNFRNLTIYATKGGVSLADIESAAETVAIAEVGKRPAADGPYVVRWSLTSSYPVSVMHMEGSNFVFCDGHVKWFKVPGKITKDATMWGGT